MLERLLIIVVVALIALFMLVMTIGERACADKTQGNGNACKYLKYGSISFNIPDEIGAQ